MQLASCWIQYKLVMYNMRHCRTKQRLNFCSFFIFSTSLDACDHVDETIATSLQVATITIAVRINSTLSPIVLVLIVQW